MSLSDVPATGEGSSLVLAARWIEGVLLGTTATLVAVIAVAGFGYLLLTGRIDLRRGAIVVLGCFILFGAPAIARGLFQLATSGVSPPIAVMPSVPVQAQDPPQPRQPVTPPVYDPYAGASVPLR